MSKTTTHQVTATPEWVARSLIQIARQPATPDDDAKLVKMILDYFRQFYDAGRAEATEPRSTITHNEQGN